MNISSVQPIYSIDSTDTITLNNFTSVSNGGYSIYTNGTSSATTPTVIGGAGSTITITGTGASGTFNINSFDSSVYNWSNEEFVNSFPDWSRIQKMCDQYPGLKIAFEKFKTTYYLVKDHYDTPEDQRPHP